MLPRLKNNRRILSDILLILLLLLGFILKSTYYYKIISLIAVIPVCLSAFQDLLKNELSIDLLASIALFFSFISGQWQSATFISLMLAFARVFSQWTSARADNLIKHLLKYRPEKVKVKRGQRETVIPLSQVKKGDLIVIEAGDRIPVDGVIVTGQAGIDESSLTGESEPVVRKIGDPVYAATLNLSGSLMVKTTSVGTDSRLEKIIALIQKASLDKSHTEKIVTRFTKIYIIAMIVLSAVLYLITRNLSLILSVLLVVCADDIAVGVPLAFTAAIARAAQNGILIKGADVLEKLPRVSVIFTDKTGTLTRGKLHVVQIVHFNPSAQQRSADCLLGSIMANSHHPISTSIVSFLAKLGCPVKIITNINEHPGEGMEAVIDNKRYLAGKIDFLTKNGVIVSAAKSKMINNYQHRGFDVTGFSCQKQLLLLVVLEDEIRPDAAEAIRESRRYGVAHWLMLTGDNHQVAAKIARLLRLDHFFSGLSPESKLDFIRDFKKKSRATVAMIGDGVNDSAALSLADVSFAMGAIGSDAAIESADIALMNDKLIKIPQTLFISRVTRNIIYQDFLIWALTNSVGLFLVFTGVFGPSQAAAFNFITDFFPIGNSLRLFFYNFADQS